MEIRCLNGVLLNWVLYSIRASRTVASDLDLKAFGACMAQAQDHVPDCNMEYHCNCKVN